MRNIAVFDFDGTLTSRDTLLDFIRFVYDGRCMSMLMGFMLIAPQVMLMKVHLLSNHAVKERMLAYFFGGMQQSELERYGRDYVRRAKTLLRDDVYARFAEHVKRGDDVYVVSASLEEWVRPVCMSLGAKAVIGTQFDTRSGRYASPNCYGAEKVRRFCEIEPERDTYHLKAYGDSRGDKEMFAFADEYEKV